MNRILVAVILASSIGIANAAPIVDVLKLAGKSQSEVAGYLGKETSCETIKYGKKCYYTTGETEIVFIKGKADWITVESMDSVPFSKSALSALGLKEMRPTAKSSFVLKWEPIQGLRSVSVFKGASNADNAYIKVKTD
jgi:hypothetical protein